MKDSIEKVIFSEEQIKTALKDMGKRITEEYAGKKPLLICILKGGIVFLSDLMRNIDLMCDVDFMIVSSYGSDTVSSGVIKIKKDLDTDIFGRDVIIVEDILDSGITLFSLKQILNDRKPASLKICAFLEKQVERVVDIKADYKCFDIENQFVVGYGLDYAQDYRNLPYIGILKKSVYESSYK